MGVPQWKQAAATPSTTRPRLEVADIVRTQLDDLQAQRAVTPEQRRAIKDITRCRTAALGGHMEDCTACGEQRPAYNSCRNRHCPKCQALSQARWVQRQAKRALPVTCFHVVFTLPAELRPIASRHPRALYNLLFASASTTLLDFGRDPTWLGAQIGVTAVLHTWARDLTLHPHVHCIVTAGGLSDDATRWVDASHNFLFPVAAMAKAFRGRFLHRLSKMRGEQSTTRDMMGDEDFQALLDKLHAKNWNVYAKAPFAGPKQIFRYLGQYTHRVGISNHRLLRFDADGVTFRTRADKTVCLPTRIFISRFLAHILPKGFVKIRHYGLMASGATVHRRQRARALLCHGRDPSAEAGYCEPRLAEDWAKVLAALTGIDVARCRSCGCYAVVRRPLPTRPGVVATRPRAPPAQVALG